MRVLYRPGVNRFLRSVLRPVSGLIPERYMFPVTGSISVRLGSGRTITLAVNPTSHLARLLFWKGVSGFEPNVSKVFVHLVPHCGVVVDVGANIGYYSILSADLNPKSTVLAFEPMPSAFRVLCANLERNGVSAVQPHQIALAASPGRGVLHVPVKPKFAAERETLTGMASLSDSVAAKRGVLVDVEVAVDTLDRFLREHLPDTPVDLIKIDTEGTEDRVLLGAAETMERSRPIVICEVLPEVIEPALEEFFKRLGYLFFRAERAGLVPVGDLKRIASTPDEHVFVPPSKLALVQGIVVGSEL